MKKAGKKAEKRYGTTTSTSTSTFSTTGKSLREKWKCGPGRAGKEGPGGLAEGYCTLGVGGCRGLIEAEMALLQVRQPNSRGQGHVGQGGSHLSDPIKVT